MATDILEKEEVEKSVGDGTERSRRSFSKNKVFFRCANCRFMLRGSVYCHAESRDSLGVVVVCLPHDVPTTCVVSPVQRACSVHSLVQHACSVHSLVQRACSVYNWTGAQHSICTRGLGHHALSPQWGWDTMRLSKNGAGTQWVWYTMSLGHDGSGTQ